VEDNFMNNTLLLILIGTLFVGICSFVFYIAYERYLNYVSRRNREIIIPEDELAPILQTVALSVDGMNAVSTDHVVTITREDRSDLVEVVVHDITTFDGGLELVYADFRDSMINKDNNETIIREGAI